MDQGKALYESVMNESIMNAVSIALQEAKETPLLPGVTVGHVNIEKYGQDTATLVSINGAEATVTMKNGETATWETEGLVDIARFNQLTNEGIKSSIRELMAYRKLENLLMGNQPNDGLEQVGDIVDRILGGEGGGMVGPDLPTPGCDCPYCASCTPEQHAEAKRLAEEQGLDLDKDSPTYGQKTKIAEA